MESLDMASLNLFGVSLEDATKDDLKSVGGNKETQ
jgi:hypothetical protein